MDVLCRWTSSVFEKARITSSAESTSRSEDSAQECTQTSTADKDKEASRLGLTYLTDSLLAMGVPVNTRTDVKNNQVNVDALATYLDRNHANHFLILSLKSLTTSQSYDSSLYAADNASPCPLKNSCSPDAQSDNNSLQNVVSKLNGQVMEWSWEGCGISAHAPSYERMFQICYGIDAWLTMNPRNIAMLFCHTGKSRSGIVAACYFLYIGMFLDPLEAFITFYRKRWGMRTLDAEKFTKGTPPSVLSFLNNFYKLVQERKVPNLKPLTLKALIVQGIAWNLQPHVQIYDDSRLLFCSKRSSTDEDATSLLKWDVDQGTLTIVWERGLDLDTNFVVLCFVDEDTFIESEGSRDSLQGQPLFRYNDSTWFVKPELLRKVRGEIDITKQLDHVVSNESFCVNLLFQESQRARREFIRIDYTGDDALRQGIQEITKRHIVLPDPSMHSNFVKMGFTHVPTTFALQVSNNAPNIALDILHSARISSLYSTKSASLKHSPSTGYGVRAESDVTHADAVAIHPRQNYSDKDAYSSASISSSCSVCCLCREDDYMLRSQLIACTSTCKRHYHTVCAKLKKIPFAISTPSDRANHEAYVKKYYQFWACEDCQSQFTENDTHAVREAIVTQKAALMSKTLGRPMELDFAKNDSVVRVSTNQEILSNDIDGVQKISDFLKSNGMSVDDLLRAAVAPHVSSALYENLSDQDCTLTDPLTSNAGSINHSPTSSDSRIYDWNNALGAGMSPDCSVRMKNCLDTQVYPQMTASDVLVSEDISCTPKMGNTMDASSFDEKCSQICDSLANADLTKYDLMLKRGVPFEAVQNCMKREGVDSKILKHSTAIADSKIIRDEVTNLHDNGKGVVASAAYQKYHNMLRFGCPKEAVKQKVIMDGLDPWALESELQAEKSYGDPKASSQNDSESRPAFSGKGIQNKSDATKATLCSGSSHTNKIISDARSSNLESDFKMNGSPILVATGTSRKASESNAASAQHMTECTLQLADDDVCTKYLKMLKIGLPRDAVQHKMRADGVDPALLDLNPTKPKENSNLEQIQESCDLLLKDHESFSKYFNMLKVGLPEGAVRQKMLSDGVDPKALELGPNAKLSMLQICKVIKSAPKTESSKAPSRRKRLHLQPISDSRLGNTNQHTIWEDEEQDALDFDMDMDELESLFFTTNDASVRKKESLKSKPLVRKKTITLIDGKKAMNAGISLARVKISNEDLANGIRRLDVSILTLEQLTSIREFLPTRAEIQVVSNFQEDLSMLGDAEKFILNISRVKRFERKMDLLIYITSFPMRTKELESSLKNITNACEEVKGSRLLKILLGMVLKLGNTLNGSGHGEEIRGFTVDSLLRLGHTKAVNQKTTVLHYLIRLVKKNHPPVLDFYDELRSVPLASRDSFDAITTDYEKLCLGTRLLESELQATEAELCDGECADASNAAVQVLINSSQHVRINLEALEKSIHAARTQVASVFEYFGEDPGKNATTFFVALSSFCSAFETARKEVFAADEAAQREERFKLRRSMTMRCKQSNASSPKSTKAKLSYSKRTSSYTAGSGNDR